FFLSSSRRHTRSKRDWSSDVCSSDLMIFPGNGCTMRFIRRMREKCRRRNGKPCSVTPSAVWNKREEKAGYYVYPAFFAPGEERKEKYDIFCKKGLTKGRGCSIIFERSTERPRNRNELRKTLRKRA